MYLGSSTYPSTQTYPGLPPIPTEYDTDFYVGPLGALLPLPGVASQVDTPLQIIGGTHVSLTGAFTQDIFGYKRSWSWTYPMLIDYQARHVESIAKWRPQYGPLYLIDPRRRNRLPEQIASGGSLLANASGFIPSNTTTSRWRRVDTVTADPTTLPSYPILRGCQEWQLLAAGGAGLELAGPSADGRLSIPAMPGEVLRVSLWATGPDTVDAFATAHVFDPRGNEIITQTAPSVALSMANWQRVDLAFICPADTAYLRMSIGVGSDAPVGSVFVTALSVERYHPTYVPGLTQYCDEPDLGDWAPGGGAPQVVPTAGQGGGQIGYVRAGLQSAALTLTER